MKKINILKENFEYTRIIKNCRYYKSECFILYFETTMDNIIYKFGISVGKKVGNAVRRNRVKRQIKSILDKKNYKNGFNCIIIVRKRINEKQYYEIEKELLNILDKLNIYKED